MRMLGVRVPRSDRQQDWDRLTYLSSFEQFPDQLDRQDRLAGPRLAQYHKPSGRYPLERIRNLRQPAGELP